MQILPDRFHTGIRNTTVPNPAVIYQNGGKTRTFAGKVEDYDFKRQTKNYLALKKVLENCGKKFSYVAAAQYGGDLHTNHRFDVLTEDGSVLWHKYVGFAAQSGQNHLFMHGMRIKVSRFLSLEEPRQRALLSGSGIWIGLVFTPKELDYINEADKLWD